MLVRRDPLVAQQHKCVDSAVAARRRCAQHGEAGFVIAVAERARLPIDAAHDHVLGETRDVHAVQAGHGALYKRRMGMPWRLRCPAHLRNRPNGGPGAGRSSPGEAAGPDKKTWRSPTGSALHVGQIIGPDPNTENAVGPKLPGEGSFHAQRSYNASRRARPAELPDAAAAKASRPARSD